MPKIKTNRSAAKRFTKTSSGRLKRAKAFKNHILSKKTRKRKNNLRQAAYVDKADQPRMQQLVNN